MNAENIGPMSYILENIIEEYYNGNSKFRIVIDV